MKVLGLQFNSVWQDSSTNLAVLKSEFEKQVDDSIDLVVLPETFHAGFSMQPHTFAESVDGVISQALSHLAKQYHVNIVAGVAQKQIRNQCGGQKIRFYNRALAFDREGQQIGSYTKRKLFSFAGEDKAFEVGAKAEILDIDGHAFALFICYDLRFPELFRELAKKVKGVILIANWPDSRQEHWETLLRARAIENQCFVIGVNRIGKDENGLGYQGGSSIYSPLGELIVYGQKDESSILADIDLCSVDLVRQKFPFLEDMT